jgi:hypothetical protein
MFIVDILKNKNIKENVKVAFKAMYTCGGGGGWREGKRERTHTHFEQVERPVLSALHPSIFTEQELTGVVTFHGVDFCPELEETTEN